MKCQMPNVKTCGARERSGSDQSVERDAEAKKVAGIADGINPANAQVEAVRDKAKSREESEPDSTTGTPAREEEKEEQRHERAYDRPRRRIDQGCRLARPGRFRNRPRPKNHAFDGGAGGKGAEDVSRFMNGHHRPPSQCHKRDQPEVEHDEAGLCGALGGDMERESHAKPLGEHNPTIYRREPECRRLRTCGRDRRERRRGVIFVSVLVAIIVGVALALTGRRRAALVTVSLAGIVALALLALLAFGLLAAERPEIGENSERVTWFPEAATQVSYFRSWGGNAYEFDIAESDFVHLAEARGWGLTEIDSPKRVLRYTFFVEETGGAKAGQGASAALVANGLWHEERQANGGGITVAYDRARGRAFVSHSSR